MPKHVNRTELREQRKFWSEINVDALATAEEGTYSAKPNKGPMMMAPAPAPARKCPYCMGEIDEKATRCPHCTSQLN